MTTSKVWFVTGSSRGLGRAFVEAAVRRGDRVAATARNPHRLAGLAMRNKHAVLPLALDVTDRAAVAAAVARAHDRFGRLDVVVNNAGYGLFGMVEELTERQLRAQLETNFFGALWVTQAVLPILRAQGHGHIVQISGAGGVTASPFLGGHNASKSALEGISEALAGELRGTGVRVTLVEPGGFDTDWAGRSGVYATPNPAYAHLHAAIGGPRRSRPAGDPADAARALLRVVDAADPPLRVKLGGRVPDAREAMAELT